MSVNSTITISKNLDQVMAHYGIVLRNVASLWSQMSSSIGHGDMMLTKRTEEMIERMEETIASFMEKEIKAEKARQAVLDLKAILDISKKTVEAKSKHLGQEEKQKEESQTIRFKEYQRIHKLQEEKVLLEKEILPTKRKLSQVKDLLEEKNEKLRNIESFHVVLTDYCAQDMIRLKDKTDERRAEKHRGSESGLDIANEIMSFSLDLGELRSLEKQVSDLKDTLHNQKIWYDEELQTKLFYSTRSKEIKRRINYYKSLLRRLEKSGRSDDNEDDSEENQLKGRSEQILVDGSPGVQANEVVNYLSQRYDLNVMADYTMLRRLKEEIGVQGLAYLVEKIRLQGSSQFSSSPSDSSYVDWEEKRVDKALRAIAMEYRDNDENKRLFRVPGLNPAIEDQREDGQPMVCSPSFSSSSNMTRDTSNTEFSGLSSPTSRKSSNNSLKRKTSLARFKKFLKM
ncbi:hypothetical protein Bpfe_017006 [Biomphalaria pfeifferi]|uniref:Uncharacterized protein n=1 Tax=Biomphalaria pfeifferi TaxID=112525 RepID=A0AAD8BFB2_BIOPF|nr:hypothetical protein Bpfe_017006 [Biomphalaria pfeifferi]